MSREKLPSFVPIHEVQEYTDSIVVHNLGLPVGFDEEQLEINLSGLARTAKMAGLGHLSIIGFRGDTTEHGIGVGSVFGDGTASAMKISTMTKAKLHDIDIENDGFGTPREYHWKNAVLKINNAEVEDRIRTDGDKWPRQQFDAQGRAKYMDKSLKGALSSAAYESILPNPPANIGEWLLMTGVREVVTGGILRINILSKADMLAATVGWLPIHALSHLATKTLLRGDTPPRKWSNMWILPLDRLVAAQALSQTTRFIRATQPKQ